MIELYRAMIPANHIINDNHNQHYKIHMGNLDWLTKQFNRIRNDELCAPGDFKIPEKNLVNNYLNNNIFSIRCEVWRPLNRRFDPQNYAKTFKAPIDLLVSNGYLPDDNWKFVNGITYAGGGYDAWKQRAVRYENDGLPKNLDIEWWKQYSADFNDILIRILIERN